jgi:hypothetical protein
MFLHCSLSFTREVQQCNDALWINFTYGRIWWSSPRSTMVRLFALRNKAQHGYQQQIFELGDSTEVQSTLAADDSTSSRNDVEQLRGSVQIECTLARVGGRRTNTSCGPRLTDAGSWSAVREPS